MPLQIIEQNAEVRLIEMLNDIRSEGAYWRVVDFHFSDLLEHYRSAVQIRIAVNLVYDLLKGYDGGIFVCQDSRLLVLVRDVMPSLLDKVIFQLRYLLMDDPLAYLASGEENPEFCTVYDLGADFDALMKFAKRRMVMINREGGPVITVTPNRNALKPFTPAQLIRIEHDLGKLDLSPVLRRQPVCASLPNTAARRVFDEVYIHMLSLRKLFDMDTDFLSNRWLFKYLTGLLDVRMLSLMMQHSLRFLASPISINLNVETILSASFTEFDRIIKTLPKVSVVVEVQVADVFVDMAAFIAARTQLQRLGYRLCLDGLTNYSLPQLDRERLGFDLAKLQWNADLEGDVKSTDVQKLAAAIRTYGANRIILSRCDNDKAVKFGQALGITLFQGRALDRVIDPTSNVEN
jgi:hypothetical protein